MVFGRHGNQNTERYENSATPDATVLVKAGYFPNDVVLPANKESILRFTTKDTYDCSASLVIPKLRIEELLPANGTKDIVIAPQRAGTVIQAGCSMGMYSLTLRFE